MFKELAGGRAREFGEVRAAGWVPKTRPRTHQIVMATRFAVTAPSVLLDAIKAALAKGLVWTDENLMGYLADPKQFLESFDGQPLKNAMVFQLKDEAKRRAAIEGLKSISACK